MADDDSDYLPPKMRTSFRKSGRQSQFQVRRSTRASRVTEVTQPEVHSSIKTSRDEKLFLAYSFFTFSFLLGSLVLILSRKSCPDTHFLKFPGHENPCLTRCDGLYADPTKCTEYYRCQDGIQIKLFCPKNTFYEVKTSSCRLDLNKDSCASEIDKKRVDFKRAAEKSSSAISTNKDKQQQKSCNRLVCYFTNRGSDLNYMNKTSSNQIVENFDASLCTHLIYSAALIEPGPPFGIWPHVIPDESIYALLKDKRRLNKDLKVLISAGGLFSSSGQFSEMARSQDTRTVFIQRTLRFLYTYDFDGLDLDWRFPTIGKGSSKRDKDNFVDLLIELRAEITKLHVNNRKKKKYIVSVHVSAQKNIIDAAYFAPVLNAKADFINIMTYDFYGVNNLYAEEVAHPSALWTANRWLDVNGAVNYWLSKGATKEKINIGISFRGVTFKVNKTKNCLNVTGKGMKGEFSDTFVYMAFNEICRLVDNDYSNQNNIFSHIGHNHDDDNNNDNDNDNDNNEWSGNLRDGMAGPYLVKDDDYIGFENLASVRMKGKYAALNGFGGISVWDVTADDFIGDVCWELNQQSVGSGSSSGDSGSDRKNNKYPLLKQIKSSCNMP